MVGECEVSVGQKTQQLHVPRSPRWSYTEVVVLETQTSVPRPVLLAG